MDYKTSTVLFRCRTMCRMSHSLASDFRAVYGPSTSDAPAKSASSRRWAQILANEASGVGDFDGELDQAQRQQ